MSVDSAYAVELKGVTFKRGSRSIFSNVDIRIPRGKVTGIMGPSGCGKTTLLRSIASERDRSISLVAGALVKLGLRHRNELLGQIPAQYDHLEQRLTKAS